MKRLVLCTLAAALVAPGSALGFSGNFDYTGHVKGNPSASVGFFVKHTGDRRKVAGFTISQVPYSCRDAPSDVTAGWRFGEEMRVKSDRTYYGAGQWTGLPLDPYGLVRGELRGGGKAAGSFKLKGELAGPATHCHTGLLEYRATRQQGP